MTELEIIAERIQDRCNSVEACRAATHAIELEALTLGQLATVVVVPAAERMDPVPSAGFSVTQSGRSGFSCILGLTSPGGFEVWEAVRDELKACLRGWRPEWASGPIQYAGHRLLSFKPEEGGKWLHTFDFFHPVQDVINEQPS